MSIWATCRKNSRILIEGLVLYKAFYEYLGDLQKEFPDTILQMHGTYSPSTGFKNGLRAFDIDVRSITANNDLFLPNGMRIL